MDFTNVDHKEVNAEKMPYNDFLDLTMLSFHFPFDTSLKLVFM